MVKESELRTLKLFKALSNVVRYKIIKYLAETNLSTNEIALKFNRKESNISQHLKILKDIDIVSYRTDNHNVIYSLKRKDIVNIIEIIENFFER